MSCSAGRRDDAGIEVNWPTVLGIPRVPRAWTVGAWSQLPGESVSPSPSGSPRRVRLASFRETGQLSRDSEHVAPNLGNDKFLTAPSPAPVPAIRSSPELTRRSVRRERFRSAVPRHCCCAAERSAGAGLGLRGRSQRTSGSMGAKSTMLNDSLAAALRILFLREYRPSQSHPEKARTRFLSSY
jgi:hypothetical protein